MLYLPYTVSGKKYYSGSLHKPVWMKKEQLFFLTNCAEELPSLSNLILPVCIRSGLNSRISSKILKKGNILVFHTSSFLTLFAIFNNMSIIIVRYFYLSPAVIILV